MHDDTQLTPMRNAFARGDLNAANQLAEAVIHRDPANIEALRTLGHIRLFQGLWTEAQAYVTRAVQSGPDDHATLLLQARIFTAQGRSEEALAVCDQLLAAAPEAVETRVAKASVLERVGRAEEAIALIEPLADDRGGHANLLARCLLRTGDARRAVDLATSAAARTDTTPRERYHLLLLRAKGLDRLGDYADAMAAAREAKTLIMPQGHDPMHFTRQVDAIIGAYSRDAMPRLRRARASARSHVFIAGMPRSGTTLAEQIIDAHPEAAGVGELKEIDIFARRLQQTITAWVPYPACAEFAEPAHLDAMARAYEQAIAAFGFPPRRLYANKNLSNILHAGFIAQVFPGARLVFMHREPRDIAVSCYFGAFRPETYPHLFDLRGIRAACADVERLMAHWLEVLPLDMLEVGYESLVQDQEAESRRLIDFTGLPWDDRCLRFWESGRTVMTLAYDQVTRPMYDTSIGRWRHYAEHFEEG